MIIVQGEDGLEFWRPELVASFTPEFRNWWRVVRSDGRVAHIPTPPPEGPWVPLGTALVQPCWLTPYLEGWRDPAGFLLGHGVLAEVNGPTPPPLSAALPYPPDEIYGVTMHPTNQHAYLWLTDHGPVEGKRRSGLAPIASRHPSMFYFKSGLHLNRRRISGIRARKPLHILTLDNGQEFTRTGRAADLKARLHLKSLVQLEPFEPARFGNYQLRDWPVELARASAEFLKALFDTPRKLIAHLIWQRFRMLSTGEKRKWAESYRGFWYESVVHTLSRAKLLKPGQEDQQVEDRGRSGELYHLMFEIMDLLVDQAKFFSLLEFGLADPKPKLTRVGELHPEIVVVTEKDDLLKGAGKVCRQLGLTHYHLGGQPSRLRTEHLVVKLRQRTLAPLWVIAFVDYDESGWVIGKAVVKQLETLGMQVARLNFLLHEKCFTEEEIRLYTHPCKSGSKARRTLARLWLESGGGIGGQALGIHASHVQPFKRVKQLFLDLLRPVAANSRGDLR